MVIEIRTVLPIENKNWLERGLEKCWGWQQFLYLVLGGMYSGICIFENFTSVYTVYTGIRHLNKSSCYQERKKRRSMLASVHIHIWTISPQPVSRLLPGCCCQFMTWQLGGPEHTPVRSLRKKRWVQNIYGWVGKRVLHSLVSCYGMTLKLQRSDNDERYQILHTDDIGISEYDNVLGSPKMKLSWVHLCGWGCHRRLCLATLCIYL
jgi:hypothetical protein